MDMVITTVKSTPAPHSAGKPFTCTLEITLEVAGRSLVNTSDPEAVKRAVREAAAKLLGMQIEVKDAALVG